MTPRHLLEPGRLAGAALLKAQSDSRLVDLTRAGNDRAFEAVVDRYKGPLLRYCSRILPDGRGEDAVQQTFLKAYNAIHADTTPLSLRSWLFGIAHNVSLNILRQRGSDHEPLEAHAEGATEAAHATIERRERFREVLAAVAALPAGQRDALLLRELEGRGHDEIARELGITGGAARQLISRARSGIRSAAAAVMPLPLVMRLTDGSAAPPTGERMAELTAAGAGVTVTKVVATAAVSGTLLGGAVAGPDLVEGDRDRRDADVAEAASSGDPDDSRRGARVSGRDDGYDRESGQHRRAENSDEDDDDDRSGRRDGDEDDRSGPGGSRDDEEDQEREHEDGDDDRSGPRSGSHDDGDAEEPDEPDEDNSNPGSFDDSGGETEDDSSGPGSGGDSDVPDLVEPDDDVIEADRVGEDSSGPGGGGD